MAFLDKYHKLFARKVLVKGAETTPFDVQDRTGSSLASIDSSGNTTVAGTLTITGGLASGASAAEINRVADVSARVVTLTADTTIVEATHEGKTLLLGEVGGNALLTVTLPAATGGGARYRFVVSVVNTSNYVINASTNSADFVGFIVANSTGDTPDLAQPWPAGATDNTITLNGTTSGGQAIGDWIEVQDVLANEWMVTGLVSASGTEVTPFSAV